MFTTKLFGRPLPWISLRTGVAVERDAAGFQVYTGNEDYEITVDSTYKGSERGGCGGSLR